MVSRDSSAFIGNQSFARCDAAQYPSRGGHCEAWLSCLL
jgi:hypothetical protein